MGKSKFFVAGVLAIGFLSTGVAKSETLSHVDAIRSGKLMVAMPASAAFIVPTDSHVAILPVLLHGPELPYRIKNYYKTAERQLQSASANGLLKPYAKEILALPLRKELLSSGHDVVSGVSWMGHASSIVLYRDHDPLNEKRMKSATFDSNVDAVAFLNPIVVFSADLRRVYAIATLTVYAWGPVHAFYMGSVNLHAATSLNGTSPALKAFGVESLAASDQTGKMASEARAQIWFADNSLRLNEALEQDLQKLRKQIISYLNGD